MRTSRKGGIGAHILAAVVVALWIFPLVLVAMSSFKPAAHFGRDRMVWFFRPSLEHYRYVFEESAYPNHLLSSIVVSVGTTILSMAAGVLAGYGLARFRTGGQSLSMWFLSTRMMPAAVALLPFFMIFNLFGILDTWLALIIAYAIFNLSFVIWLSRSFFIDIPQELEEVAMIDGCTRLGAFFRVALPMARTGLIATAAFTLIFSWNEYLLATVLTSSDTVRTLPASVGKFLTNYQIVWGPMFAESVLIILPVLLIAILLQPYMIRGMTMGALK